MFIKTFNKKIFSQIVFSVLLSSLLVCGFVFAWTAPSSNPPSGNVDAPINVGSTAQTKEGDLNIGGGLKYWITKDGDSFALKNDAGEIKFIIGQDGNVGIGTTSPAEKLEVNGAIKLGTTNNANAGTIRWTGTDFEGYTGTEWKSFTSTLSGSFDINVEALTGDKTLTPGIDVMYQYLAPNGADRVITLATSTAKAGDRFIIRNNDPYDSTYRLTIQQGASVLDHIWAQAIRTYIFDGTNWIAGDNGTTRHNVAIGSYACGHNQGTAVGSGARGHSYGAAVGRDAQGYNYGAAVGHVALGYDYGVAVGYLAFGWTNGVAVGSHAYGPNYGVAVGRGAEGYNNGIAVGYKAKGAYNGVSVGYQAGYNLDASFFSPDSPNKNILIGYKAGYNITRGNNNIIIGYDIEGAANDNNKLNIGNTIYGDLLSGNVGIGTTSPAEKLEVNGAIKLGTTNNANAGTIRWTGTDFEGYTGTEWKSFTSTLSGSFDINVEALTGDKTLTPGIDAMYQYLAPNGADRVITLATSTAKAGDRFIIRNNDPYYFTYRLTIQQGASVLDHIWAQAIRTYIFDGTNWIAGDNDTGRYFKDYNVAIGYDARGYNAGIAVGRSAVGYNHGAAVGYNAHSYNYGVAVGFLASGYDYGAAVGYGAKGYNNGAAVGHNAYGYDNGVAVGFFAHGYNDGAAVGSSAYGYNYGVAVGFFAEGSNNAVAVGYYAYGHHNGVAVGYAAKSNNYGVAVGYRAKGAYNGVSIGYQAGYNLNTSLFSQDSPNKNILIGYKAGYNITNGNNNTKGNNNIIIGYDIEGAPDDNNKLNIGNTIYGDLLSGNVGIGAPNPTSRLYVDGDITATGSKNFEIDHPTKPGYKLVHSSLEGPERAVFYRGESQLVNGKVVVKLPDYFEALTRKEGRTILLTPKFESEDEPISQLASSEIKDGRFTVKSIDSRNPSQKFYWEVKAVRADIPPLKVEIKKK